MQDNRLPRPGATTEETLTKRSILSFACILCFRGFTASSVCLLVSSHPRVCLKNCSRRATKILANVYAKKLSKHPERKPGKYKNSNMFLISLYLYAWPLDFIKKINLINDSALGFQSVSKYSLSVWANKTYRGHVLFFIVFFSHHR